MKKEADTLKHTQPRSQAPGGSAGGGWVEQSESLSSASSSPHAFATSARASRVPRPSRPQLWISTQRRGYALRSLHFHAEPASSSPAANTNTHTHTSPAATAATLGPRRVLDHRLWRRGARRDCRAARREPGGPRATAVEAAAYAVRPGCCSPSRTLAF